MIIITFSWSIYFTLAQLISMLMKQHINDTVKRSIIFLLSIYHYCCIPIFYFGHYKTAIFYNHAQEH